MQEIREKFFEITIWMFLGQAVFHTEDNYQYDSSFNLLLDDSKSITFSVQASSDAHIGFMCDSCNDFYEIIIGGWANTKSVIRRKPLGTHHGDETNSASTFDTII